MMMRLLLDSHVLIWAAFDVRNLSETSRNAISNSKNEKLVSPISVFELELKRVSGKLPYQMPTDWGSALSVAGYSVAPVTVLAVTRAANLPLHHRDPWDRLLIAQALIEDLTVVTTDRFFRSYGVSVLW
jgi:PIN domain nuclease of toxin-antitoxin system